MNKLKLSLVITGVLVALKFGAFDAAWMFLLVGAVPGTSYRLSAGAMLIVLGVITWLAFCQPTVNHSVRHFVARSRETKKTMPVARMPQRRYSQI